MNNYAFFICSNIGYLPFLNVLFNSMIRHGITCDVHLIHDGILEEYIGGVQKFLRNLKTHIINKNDFNIHEFNKDNRNLFIKQARFRYIREHGINYDAICMLDADMFLTTSNFMNLFDLVKGTNKLIGCNERFKWMFNRRYMHQDERIFDAPIRAFKFSCSVPIIFDLKKWIDVFDYYNSLAYNAFEVDEKDEIKKPIGDIYCWNISVYKNNRQDDVILFPMETMAQVHHTYALPRTFLKKINNVWVTEAGDEVFSIHGRIGNPAWFDGQVRGLTKFYKEFGMNEAVYLPKAIHILKSIQKEWAVLNFKSSLPFQDFFPMQDFWKELIDM